MFIGTLKLNRALQFVFGSLALFFFLLAVGDVTGSVTLKKIAGHEGLVFRISAIYTGLVPVLKEVHGKTLASLGPLK